MATKATPPGWDSTLKKNVEIVRDALRFTLVTLRKRLPAPPPSLAQWPHDFNSVERKYLQRFCREQMTKHNDDMFQDSISPEAMNAFCEELVRHEERPS